MKKLPLLFIFVFAVTCAFSQDRGVEVFIGGSSSTLRGDIEDDLSRRAFVYGGVLFLMPLKDQFKIKAGFAYSARGAENVKLDYIELPVLLSYTVQKIDFLIGPQAALLIRSNSSLEETHDFGLKYGIGAELGSNQFIRALFYHGFSNIVDYPGIHVTNRYISLTYGYRFGSHAAE